MTQIILSLPYIWGGHWEDEDLLQEERKAFEVSPDNASLNHILYVAIITFEKIHMIDNELRIFKEVKTQS